MRHCFFIVFKSIFSHPREANSNGQIHKEGKRTCLIRLLLLTVIDYRRRVKGGLSLFGTLGRDG